MYIAAMNLFQIIFFVSEIIIQEKGSKLLKDVTDNNTKGRYIFLLSMMFGKLTCTMVDFKTHCSKFISATERQSVVKCVCSINK